MASKILVYKNKYTSALFSFLSCIVLVVVDQWIKFMVFYRDEGWFLDALRPVIGRQLFLNDKFAFSLPLPPWIMYGIYAIIFSVILGYIIRNFFTLTISHKIAWIFVIAGAASNIGERIYYGHVKDFIYIFSGIFNIADLFIILGIIMLLLFHKDNAW